MNNEKLSDLEIVVLMQMRSVLLQSGFKEVMRKPNLNFFKTVKEEGGRKCGFGGLGEEVKLGVICVAGKMDSMFS